MSENQIVDASFTAIINAPIDKVDIPAWSFSPERETPHGEHKKRTGQRDADWPDWYAEYIVQDQAGKQLPS